LSPRIATVIGALTLLALAPSAIASQRFDATRAPIRVVRVSWGSIGYRVIGQGRPLVLLMGGGGTALSIDDWTPTLIDLLAEGTRVYAMDYEGIGLTTARRGPITINRLGDDTADFIRALHLRGANVMGWSMGGDVGQSLAVRHRGLVRRLILCASKLGDGTAVAQRVKGSPAYAGQWLFPFDSQNRARANAYEGDIHSYPGYYEGPARIGAGETATALRWTQGRIPQGHLAATIKVPVLVGDGAQDQLAPTPDSKNLARALPHSTLKLYANAGHGFLFQDQGDWSRRVLSFVGRG
jgi:pimeloyl-ACP methyl ester carboxylesterase